MLNFIILLITSTYFCNAQVVDIENGNTIVVETEDGNIWAMDSNKDFEIGEEVTVKFYNNLTDEIEDDRILKIFKGETK